MLKYAMVTVSQSPGFDIDKYVDMSGISDPRMASEMRRTLEYFASKPEGRELIEQAAKRGGHDKIILLASDRYESAYDADHHAVNISPHQVATNDYYTSPDKDEAKTAPMTLPQCLWHELEHARDPIYDRIKTPEFQNELHGAVEKSWMESRDTLVSMYAYQHPDAVKYTVTDPAFKDVPMDKVPPGNRTVVSVDGVPIADIDRMVIDRVTENKYAEWNHKPSPPFKGNPTPFAQTVSAEAQYNLVEGIHDQLFEEPAIARSNAGMKVFEPNDPPRFTHDGTDSKKVHAVNSGTLSKEEQIKEDAKFGYKDPGLVPAEPAHAAPNKTHAPGHHTPAAHAPAEHHAALVQEPKSDQAMFAGLDLKGLNLSKEIMGGMEMNIAQAHSAAPNVAAIAQGQQQSSGRAA